jgi:hypothetical protein
MRKRFAAVPLAFFALLAVLVPGAAAQSSGTWSVEPAEKTGVLQLRLEASNAQHGSFDMSRPLKLTELQGLTAAQMASPSGETVHFQIVREAGTFVCDGYFKQRRGSGTFTFHENPRFAPALRAMGITGVDQRKVWSMAFLDVTTAWARELKAAGVNVHTAEQLVKMGIFRVTPDYVRSLQSLGYTVTEPNELTKLRIFHVTPDSIRRLRQAGYHPDTRQLVKMSIFKVTPEFIRQVKQLGYENVMVEDLVRMRIFHVTPEYIRTMHSRGLKDLTIEKLVRMRIAGIT